MFDTGSLCAVLSLLIFSSLRFFEELQNFLYSLLERRKRNRVLITGYWIFVLSANAFEFRKNVLLFLRKEYKLLISCFGA